MWTTSAKATSFSDICCFALYSFVFQKTVDTPSCMWLIKIILCSFRIACFAPPDEKKNLALHHRAERQPLHYRQFSLDQSQRFIQPSSIWTCQRITFSSSRYHQQGNTKYINQDNYIACFPKNSLSSDNDYNVVILPY